MISLFAFGFRVPGSSKPTRLTLTLLTFSALLTSSLRGSERDDWRQKMQPITPLGYVVRHVATAVKIDGKLDDAAWGDAPWTSDFVDIEGNAKPKPRFRTRAKLLWDDTYLYIAADLAEPHVWATLTEHDSVIFRDPDFEVFIDPDGDTHAYSEFEINARNTSWDLLLDKPYQDGGPARNEWEIPELKTAVRVFGTLNKASDTDQGWTVEIALPWSAFAEHARHPGPPTEGEQWRLNFSRVEWQITTSDGTYQKVPDVPEDNWVWSPQGVIDMHRPEMWGVLQFTRLPANRPIAVAPIPAKAARDTLLEIYYAQRDFFKTHERWAATLEELGWPSRVGADRVALTATENGYECRAVRQIGDQRTTWTIRQDRRLSSETELMRLPLPSATPAR